MFICEEIHNIDPAQLIDGKGHRRRMSNVEVLNRASELMGHLTHTQTILEEEKKLLMIRRTKLFEEFTRKLEGLPVAVKKKAVLVTFIFHPGTNVKIINIYR
jgi:DNA-binding transcriptional regulator/RsmH inhibitor MraZ